MLESGSSLGPVEVAYETYGTLNAAGTNAVYVCHALTGDAHAAGHHGDPDQRGWWDNLIGPGRAIDTRRFFVVCSNLLGGCQGTTGPSSINPTTGTPYGLAFPLFTVRDLVQVHRALAAHLGITHLAGAIGGSLGGMQVLQWVIDYPDDIAAAMVICSSSHISAQNIAFSAVAREAIMRDPDFQGGDYYTTGRAPDTGLTIARMMAHITYLSEAAMLEKFGRRLQHGDAPHFGFDVDFQVESYLQHQGEVFLERFDANTYLYMTRVMDYFDAFADSGAAGECLTNSSTRCLVVSFDSDWRFATEHSREIVRQLQSWRMAVTFREIRSPWGHDSFLLEIPEYHRTVAAFLDRTATDHGIE